jgi:eukaryotic-like serine/threonine-protein kinase
MPHNAADRVCPTTGRPIEAGPGTRSRMTEMPPPERRPEPLGFDPAKNRIRAEREAAARSAELQRPVTATQVPTRSLQTDLIGRKVSDRYIVKDVLGEGGMGTVYEAEHMGLGRAVAIKVLNPAQAKKRVAVKRFQQEARAAGAIGHPNICEVYDLGQLDDGSPYLVMEKLIGTTLADRISREGGLPFDEVADVMIQVLSGLIAAHDKGIVHRDIKPENIFLARRAGCPPIVKILDFGVSKMMPQFQGGDEQLDLTRTGMVMGTPYYMSPEQARGERNLDGRVDVYACGVMMYEAIVGKRPFLAPNYNALLLSIINTTPKAIREVRPATPLAMEGIVIHMMAKARDDRYPSANAVLRDIQALPVAAAAPVNRMPAPPTVEERMRAPVLGGRPRDPRDDPAARSTRRGPRVQAGANEGAGATLRSRMADAEPPSRDGATRLDIRTKGSPEPRFRADESSGSVDIPIHITGSDLSAVSSAPSPASSQDDVEDVPTQIFRPGMHLSPNLARPPTPVIPPSPSATRISPAGAPVQRGGAPVPRGGAPVQRGAPAAHPRTLDRPPLASVNVSELSGDDWDGETVVKRPADLSLPFRRESKPFNPDETVNLNGEIDVDFSDETQHSPPPRRSR